MHIINKGKPSERIKTSIFDGKRAIEKRKKETPQTSEDSKKEPFQHGFCQW